MEPHHHDQMSALRWLAGNLTWGATLAALRAPTPCPEVTRERRITPSPRRRAA